MDTINNRPNSKDTEEDILKLQAEFLQNKIKPAAKLVKSDDLAAKISNAPIENEIECDKNEIAPILVGKIVEKVSDTSISRHEMTMKFSSGFPQAKRRQVTTSGKAGSIFSQQNKKIKNVPTTSSPESTNIHDENVETLAKMSEKEILEEQNTLLKSLDPKIVEFLKRKKVKETKEVKMEINEMEINEVEIKELCVTIEEIETPKEIIDCAEKWLHFDQIEMEKLQWMKNIVIPKINAENEPYEARFDFKGWLLPYTETEISEESRVLYHHGEEPGRPGYTLKELFQLCRSNVNQQRIFALKTISNILIYNSTGIYDNIIEIPVEQIFFLIRISLDESTPNILNASIKAMHDLFYFQIDEKCLEIIDSFGCGTIQPILTVDNQESNEDDRDVNDQQLAELDLVKCLARTDILIRIRYIINTVQPSTDTIIYCIELLTRLLRDSQKIVTQIYNTENLVSSIIRNFVPKIYKLEDSSVNCYGKPLIPAIKLLRILACRNKYIAEELIKKYNIIQSIISYISNPIAENIIGVKIQIESFKLLTIFFRYQIGLEFFSDLQPFLLSSIHYHFRNTNCDETSSYTLQSHFSSIMNIISELSNINNNYISNFIPLLMQCTTKYCCQVSNLSVFKCGKLQIISSLLFAMTNIIKNSPLQTDDYFEKLIFSLLTSNGFNKITENIKNSSNLLSTIEPHKTSENLCSLGSAIWDNTDHVIPILNTNSCVPFLSCLSYYIANSSDKIILKFLNHPNIKQYLILIKNVSKFNLTSNWFTKLEAQLILNILKSSVKVQKNVTDIFLYFELTIKCLSIFTIEHKSEIDYLLLNIVFNKQFYPTEVLMKEINLNDNKNELLNILSYLGEIYQCYIKVLDLKKNHNLFQSNLSLNIKIGNIIPLDWIFSPIISLYSQFEENSLKKIDENDQILIVTRCLQWIFLYETYFPELSSFMHQTDKFCRLSCIFLCSNTLFLEKDIHNLLEICLKVLVRPENIKKINFDQNIQGLNNFEDFYVQLLQQYQGVSYGDKLFANFILIPLAQRHNSKWRKIFWSEYLGAAQTIILDLNQSIIDLKEFLEPPESDLSLLKCYRRALVSNQLNRSEFLKYIANFHVDNFVKKI